MKGKSIVLKYNSNGGTTNYDAGSTTTDEDGNFSFTYTGTPNSPSSSLDLTYEVLYAYNTILGRIPQNQNMDVGNIYLDSNVYMVVRIKTEKPYTNRDTLFYYLGSSMNPKQIIGPFANGQVLDTLLVYLVQGWENFDQPQLQQTIYYTFWRLGKNYTDPKFGNLKWALVTPCEKYNEVVLDLTKAVF